MSTIEGGMICTDDFEAYEKLRMLRSHGMIRKLLQTIQNHTGKTITLH